MSTLNIDNDDDDDEFKRILFPVLSSNISPLRPSITSSSYRDTNQYECLFIESCAQIQEQITHRRWPFCPIYLLHINTYCHIDYFSIPAEIALVETTFWPQLYGSTNDVQSMNISKKSMNIMNVIRIYTNVSVRLQTIFMILFIQVINYQQVIKQIFSNIQDELMVYHVLHMKKSAHKIIINY